MVGSSYQIAPYQAHLQAPSNGLYYLRISATLLAQLAIVDVSAEDLIEFADTTIRKMLEHKSNYRAPYQRSVSAPDGIRIVRGYYPDTPIFFKLVLIPKTDNSYFAKISHLDLQDRNGQRRAWNASLGECSFGYYTVNSESIEQKSTVLLENSLLDAKSEVPLLIKKPPKKQRCMSPQGMQLFKYKKKKKR